MSSLTSCSNLLVVCVALGHLKIEACKEVVTAVVRGSEIRDDKAIEAPVRPKYIL